MPEAQVFEHTSAGDAELTTELVPPSDARAAMISIDPERLGGFLVLLGLAFQSDIFLSI